ncbi:hypothetical protein AB1Y20_007917 [Prymnesium parvum]|uniref:Pseudouridine synthase RsuA/RluA-like domain-containing protein n=1 Tax=Prymnesium parvum TaxID=97485 RepID=A0AB34IT68_PRYPA
MIVALAENLGGGRFRFRNRRRRWRLWAVSASKPPARRMWAVLLASRGHAFLSASPSLLPRRTPPPSALSPAASPRDVPPLLMRWDAAPAPPLTHTFSSESLEALDGETRLAQLAAVAFAELGSKSQAVAALKRGDLRLNDQPYAEGCRRLIAGDRLTLELPPRAPLTGKRLEARCRFIAHLTQQGLRCVHEDDDLAVVFKPGGVHTKARQNPKFGALEDALPALLSPPAAADGLPAPLAMHRLDVRVSGLLLVAKTRAAALALSRQFEAHRVGKRYEALLVGAPPDELQIDTPVEVDGVALPSHSELRVVRRQPHPQWGVLSHVQLSPRTGRTHQLRVHTASLGMPIVGDDLYWDAAVAARARLEMPPLPPVRRGGGLFLQSSAIEFDHPRSGERVSVEMPAEPKFAALLERAQRGDTYHKQRAEE